MGSCTAKATSPRPQADMEDTQPTWPTTTATATPKTTQQSPIAAQIPSQNVNINDFKDNSNDNDNDNDSPTINDSWADFYVFTHIQYNNETLKPTQMQTQRQQQPTPTTLSSIRRPLTHITPHTIDCICKQKNADLNVIKTISFVQSRLCVLFLFFVFFGAHVSIFCLRNSATRISRLA